MFGFIIKFTLCMGFFSMFGIPLGVSGVMSFFLALCE
jgi:hypothetical protein